MADLNAFSGYTGFTADNGKRGANLRSTIEDFMMNEYQEGLINEFSMNDALINSLKKDTITGAKKYKQFALGILDNVRAIGNGDLYKIDIGDFSRGVDTVEASFDTTKFIGVFSITDEALLKSQGSDCLIDFMKDSLSRMELGLKNTQSRYTYGGHKGKIGEVKTSSMAFEASTTENIDGYEYDLSKPYTPASSNERCGNRHIENDIIKFECTNSSCLISGMGLMFKVKGYATASDTTPWIKYRQGKIWQIDDSSFDKQVIYVVLDAYDSADTTMATAAEINAATPNDLVVATDSAAGTLKTKVEIYSKQFVKNNIVEKEYHGLEDIIIHSNATDDDAILFGIDRRVYPSFRSKIKDCNNQLLTEYVLRGMADNIDQTASESFKVNLVCSKASIISTLEQQMYKFRSYSMDTAANGFKLGGRSNITFDNYEFKKDNFARDNNVYFLNTDSIGELVRKDFSWITSGRETILERREGTEIYEAIMTKYADMYIESFRANAACINVKDSFSESGIYARPVEIISSVTSPVNTKEVDSTTVSGS